MKINFKIKKEDLRTKLDIKDPVDIQGEEIVKKLESLTGSDRLDASAIKNLPKSEVRSVFGGGLSKATADILYAPKGSTGSTPQNETFTYDGSDNLTRIDYADGSYKTFTYSGSDLNYITWVNGGTTIIKTFVYDSGDLIAINIT
jgi:YD repeat-containing protein